MYYYYPRNFEELEWCAGFDARNINTSTVCAIHIIDKNLPTKDVVRIFESMPGQRKGISDTAAIFYVSNEEEKNKAIEIIGKNYTFNLFEKISSACFSYPDSEQLYNFYEDEPSVIEEYRDKYKLLKVKKIFYKSGFFNDDNLDIIRFTNEGIDKEIKIKLSSFIP